VGAGGEVRIAAIRGELFFSGHKQKRRPLEACALSGVAHREAVLRN
jgi:hypothetical protein